MKYLSFLVLAILIGCTFPRDNPLDPQYSGMEAPAKVTNVNTISYSDKIKLEWDYDSRASGYFVYRSGFYNGKYERIADVENVSDINWEPSYDDTDNSLVPRHWYYYRVSAYIVIDADLPEPLEGEFSEKKEGIIQ